MGGGSAIRAVCVGEQLVRIPESAQALRDGEIGFAHLGLIAATAKSLTESPTSHGFSETRLLESAKRVSVRVMQRACLSYRHTMDPQAYVEEERRGVEARFLEIHTGDEGDVWLKGWLERRQADALLDLVGGTAKPLIQVTTTAETLVQLAGAPAAEVELGLPLSGEAVRRLACDCSLVRVLLRGESKMIDVGRSSRTVPPALRRALQAKHPTCRWPGCERPASRCDGHHLKHWADGGETTLDNTVLLCRRHHWCVHEGGWRIQKLGEEIAVMPPKWEWQDWPAA